jgi:hypothetical protein
METCDPLEHPAAHVRRSHIIRLARLGGSHLLDAERSKEHACACAACRDREHTLRVPIRDFYIVHMTHFFYVEGGDEELQKLACAAKGDKDASCRAAAVAALVAISPKGDKCPHAVINVINDCLRDSDAQVQKAAAVALGLDISEDKGAGFGPGGAFTWGVTPGTHPERKNREKEAVQDEVRVKEGMLTSNPLKLERAVDDAMFMRMHGPECVFASAHECTCALISLERALRACRMHATAGHAGGTGETGEKHAVGGAGGAGGEADTASTQHAAVLRLKGNHAYRSGDYAEAQRLFVEAIEAIDVVVKQEDVRGSEMDRLEAWEMRQACQQNAAAGCGCVRACLCMSRCVHVCV